MFSYISLLKRIHTIVKANLFSYETNEKIISSLNKSSRTTKKFWNFIIFVNWSIPTNLRSIYFFLSHHLILFSINWIKSWQKSSIEILIFKGRSKAKMDDNFYKLKYLERPLKMHLSFYQFRLIHLFNVRKYWHNEKDCTINLKNRFSAIFQIFKLLDRPDLWWSLLKHIKFSYFRMRKNGRFLGQTNIPIMI